MKHFSRLIMLAVTALFTFSASVTPVHAAWTQTNGKWQYSDSTNNYFTGWNYIDGKWYLFDEDGWMITGWKELNGEWYYMDSSGEMVTGWLLDAGNWYFMDLSGAMLTDTITPDGYWIGSDGVLVQTSESWDMFEQENAVIIEAGSPISNIPYDGYTIVVNTNTKKYHRPTCRYVETIKSNHIAYCNDEAYLISQDYSACKVCY